MINKLATAILASSFSLFSFVPLANAWGYTKLYPNMGYEPTIPLKQLTANQEEEKIEKIKEVWMQTAEDRCSGTDFLIVKDRFFRAYAKITLEYDVTGEYEQPQLGLAYEMMTNDWASNKFRRDLRALTNYMCPEIYNDRSYY